MKLTDEDVLYIAKQVRQEPTMHLNGGSNYSSMSYDITIMGESVGLRSTQTDGSPNYKIVSDIIHMNNEELDFRVSGKKKLARWMVERLPSDLIKRVLPPLDIEE